MNLWEQIKQYWEREGLAVGQGVSASELDEFERRYSVALPPSMRDYFQTVNGTNDMGSDFFHFWALKDVKLVSEELTQPYHTDRLNYPNCFIFVDYLIWCWAYAVELSTEVSREGPVYRIAGTSKKEIAAETFSEFMQRYAVDPEDLI